jgi:hypothetical protein
MGPHAVQGRGTEWCYRKYTLLVRAFVASGGAYCHLQTGSTMCTAAQCCHTTSCGCC